MASSGCDDEEAKAAAKSGNGEGASREEVVVNKEYSVAN